MANAGDADLSAVFVLGVDVPPRTRILADSYGPQTGNDVASCQHRDPALELVLNRCEGRPAVQDLRRHVLNPSTRHRCPTVPVPRPRLTARDPETEAGRPAGGTWHWAGAPGKVTSAQKPPHKVLLCRRKVTNAVSRPLCAGPRQLSARSAGYR